MKSGISDLYEVGAVELKHLATVSIVLYQNRSLTGLNPEQFQATVAIREKNRID
jgi:hypothetical protein